MIIKNWKDESEYEYLKKKDVPGYQWRWEFLRRNPEYQKDWEMQRDIYNEMVETGNWDFKILPNAKRLTDGYLFKDNIDYIEMMNHVKYPSKWGLVYLIAPVAPGKDKKARRDDIESQSGYYREVPGQEPIRQMAFYKEIRMRFGREYERYNNNLMAEKALEACQAALMTIFGFKIRLEYLEGANAWAKLLDQLGDCTGADTCQYLWAANYLFEEYQKLKKEAKENYPPVNVQEYEAAVIIDMTRPIDAQLKDIKKILESEQKRYFKIRGVNYKDARKRDEANMIECLRVYDAKQVKPKIKEKDIAKALYPQKPWYKEKTVENKYKAAKVLVDNPFGVKLF